ncbi:hypothetical protein EG68_08180 [Paragonimus skrjabini miyazakii]|uniref:Eukaryotic translation initiation factor 2A n=1 Tax=Paragonimus skrjabini miyazakii TaxID=59628 RepID=A0A8S9YJU5_9TREM|nr:hypothetical protein EG68_08180 [Paragonimus skrjabini miyazakii]
MFACNFHVDLNYILPKVWQAMASEYMISSGVKHQIFLTVLSLVPFVPSPSPLRESSVTVFNTEKRLASQIPFKGASNFLLSPCGRILFIHESYRSSVEQLQGSPNVHIYATENGRLLKEYTYRFNDGWQPQWTSDSSLCAVRIDGEVQIYINNQFDSKPTGRLAVKGLRHFSLCSSSTSAHIAAYIPSQKSQPSSVRIYQWHNSNCNPIANKSFYRTDSIRLLWNDRGTDLLVLASTKLSDESYYGDQSLYYITANTSGNNAIVTMPRKGPIYQVAWRPTQKVSTTCKTLLKRPGEECFVVCHGFVPASVTVFGLDCEPRFHFGTGSWNQIHFNPHGNLLLLAGLGGLTGDMSVWDFDRCERLSCFKTTDITSLAWLNDGEHLLLATTTPRLRVNNGFGVWHYSGQQLFFKRVDSRAVPRPATLDLPAATEHELYQIYVLPVTELPPAPVPRKFEPCADSTANPTKKYVPPALRNRSDVAKQSISASYPSENSAPGKYQPPSTKMDLPVGLDPSYLVSQKSKKRKSKPNSQNPASATSISSQLLPAQPNRHAPGDSVAEKNKKIRVLKKKLSEIAKLREEQAAGTQLDGNQLNKMSTEADLRAQLAQLTVSS